jgi:hypothetical protein
MVPRDLPSVLECWKHLEQYDDAMARAFAARDTRTFGRLEARRRWWADQLEQALNREGFPRRENDSSNGVTTTVGNG